MQYKRVHFDDSCLSKNTTKNVDHILSIKRDQLLLNDINGYYRQILPAGLLEEIVSNASKVIILPSSDPADTPLNNFNSPEFRGEKFLIHIFSENQGPSSKYVIQIPLGVSHLTQTAGALLCYQNSEGKQLSRDQIQIINNQTTNIGELFYKELNNTGINKIDITMMLGRFNWKGLLVPYSQNTSPLQIRTPNIQGTLFNIRGKNLLVAYPMAPYYFGDRAGYFLQACTRLSLKHLIVSSTCGGFNGYGLKRGQMVIPQSLLVRNSALDILADLQIQTTTHTTVTSIEDETKDWYSECIFKHINTVDCESDYITHSIHGQGVDLYQALIISDIINTSKDLSHAAYDKSYLNNGIPQIEVLKIILQHLLDER